MNNNVLTAEDLLNLFSSTTFQNLLTLIQKPLIEKIEKLEEKNNEMIDKIKQLENTTQILTEKIKKMTEATTNQNTIYTQLQMEKRNNLIVTGLEEENNEDLKSRLTQIFHEKFNKTEIKFECERIGKPIDIQPNETETARKPRAIRIKFYSIWDRRTIYSNRIKSLHNTGIFFNEDLMSDKAKLAYEARKLKRQQRIYATYTNEGQVFFKQNETSEPEELNQVKLNELLSAPSSNEEDVLPTMPTNTKKEEGSEKKKE